MNARVTGLRGLEFAVFDLDESAAFYKKAWALEEVSRGDGKLYMRGAGKEHHILTLHEKPRAGLVSVNFAAPDRYAVDALHARAKAMACDVVSAPQAISKEAGGGYGFEVKTPEGHLLRISNDVMSHDKALGDEGRPTVLNHVVLNSADQETQMRFFFDVLGFKFSDCNGFMNFIRCSANHHAIAFAQSQGPSFNHAAFEMTNVQSLMEGVGRMRMADQEVGWGVGKHAGPGRNVFAYFVDPNGFTIEYTTDVDQVDDSYESHGGDYWASLPLKPCAWAGDKTVPKDWLRYAMSGKDIEDRNAKCDDVISKKQFAAE
jgi:catechol-2,3-dioxygenase